MAEISDLVARALALRDAGASDAEVLEHMGPMDQEDYSVLKSVLSIAPRSFRPSSQPRLLSGAATEACAESSMSGAVVVECVQESLRGVKRKCKHAATDAGLGVEELGSLHKELAEGSAKLQESVRKLAESEKDAVEMRQALQKLQAEGAASAEKLAAAEEELTALRSEALEMRQALQKTQTEGAASVEKLAAAEEELKVVMSEALEMRQALQKIQTEGAASAEKLAGAKEELTALRSEALEMRQALQESEEVCKRLQQKLRDAENEAKKSQEHERTLARRLTKMKKELKALAEESKKEQDHKQEVEQLRNELNSEKMRKITIKLGAGSTQGPNVRVLDFAIRAACLATTTELVMEGRLLYRPDFCLLTFARELSLLRSIDIATLDAWNSWDWNVKRVSHLCGAELVKDGVVDAKGVFTMMMKGMLRGKDQLCLSKEEITSMKLQLEDLENLQDLERGSLASPCYAEYREWQMRALEEYFLWVTERGRTKKNNCVPSSAAAQRDAMEWYKTCSEAYAVSVTLGLKDRQEVPNNYWVPMAAAVYSKVRPRPVIL